MRSVRRCDAGISAVKVDPGQGGARGKVADGDVGKAGGLAVKLVVKPSAASAAQPFGAS